MVFILSVASGCSAAPSQDDTAVAPVPASSQRGGATNIGDEPITWDREKACAEANTAVGQFNHLFDGLISEAREALDGGGREEADAAGHKYAPEFERVGNKLISMNTDDIEVGRAISRFGEAMLGYAMSLEEGFFTSESDFSDEPIFAAIELQGVC